jgi:hypothetical protein
MADLERFDPALLGVAQQVSAAAAPGDNPIDTLLDIYFGFLRRKTDFFRRVAAASLAPAGARICARGRASGELCCAKALRSRAPLRSRAGATAVPGAPRGEAHGNPGCGAWAGSGVWQRMRSSQRARKHVPWRPLTRPLLRSGGAAEGRAKDAVLRALSRQSEIAAREEAGAWLRAALQPLRRPLLASTFTLRPRRNALTRRDSLLPTDRAREAAKAAARAEASRSERASREAAANAQARAEEEARKARLRAAAAPPPSCSITELDDDAAAAAGEAAPPAPPAADDDAAALDAREEEEARGKQKPNAGNGGEAEWGVWTQTLGDAELRVSVPPGTTSKAIAADIKKNSIAIGLKGQPPLLAGACSSAADIAWGALLCIVWHCSRFAIRRQAVW